MPQSIEWHGKSWIEHMALRALYYAQGYRFVSLSIYGDTSNPVYAAVMVQQQNPVEQTDFYNMNAPTLQAMFDLQALQGFGPMILCATAPSGENPLFAAVFQAMNPIPFTQWGMSLTDLQNNNSAQKAQGAILSWAAAYGTGSNAQFAGIWVPNPDNTLWNNDGIQDSGTDYQSRFDAETQAWCRPSFVTLNGDSQYLSVFAANEIGNFEGQHGMSLADYDLKLVEFTLEGMYPVLVQAAGSDAVSAEFAAIFAGNNRVIPRQFTATGPIANAGIDAAVESIMTAYPEVRQASLAIVNGTQLVYARGYTMAEPDWPITQPTTCFRLASVSKTVTAFAIFQLIDSGQLALTDTMQSILGLTTPGGGVPVDSRFDTITIQNLLEHTSGADPGADGGGMPVIDAYAAAGISKSLPITQQMLDSYIAAQMLDFTPGTQQAYTNTGYYLLGRVVAKILGQDSLIDACGVKLFPALNITRIRSALDLISQQLPDEARYQATDLEIASSQQTPDQPWVQSGYGDYDLAVAQGGKGVSAAATDLARLVAIAIDQNDNPAMKRATLNTMFSNAVTTYNTWHDRAGYGLDVAAQNSDGSFYGQKGGEISDAAGVFQFNDQWGFVLCFGGQAQTPGNASWYPNFYAGMSIAVGVDWTEDLFPMYGMPPL